jgi:hypothetical protein
MRAGVLRHQCRHRSLSYLADRQDSRLECIHEQLVRQVHRVRRDKRENGEITVPLGLADRYVEHGFTSAGVCLAYRHYTAGV